MEKATGYKKIIGPMLLLITALIWGISFVAQSVGMESIGAFTFSGTRTLLGAVVLLPAALMNDSKRKKLMPAAEHRESFKTDIRHGIILGLVFFVACNLQQFAFYYSTPGKIAFITALYIFFVPIFGMIFFKKRFPAAVWICAAVALAGLYMLCIGGSGIDGVNTGDLLALLCSVGFAVHILLIDMYAPGANGALLSCVQFFVGGGISAVLMFIFEDPDPASMQAALIPILYSGILSCGIAYTFQIIGQKYTDPSVASLLMCMESVFAVIASAIILGQFMNTGETIGCILMFAAIVISQIFTNRASKTDL